MLKLRVFWGVNVAVEKKGKQNETQTKLHNNNTHHPTAKN